MDSTRLSRRRTSSDDHLLLEREVAVEVDLQRRDGPFEPGSYPERYGHETLDRDEQGDGSKAHVHTRKPCALPLAPRNPCALCARRPVAHVRDHIRGHDRCHGRDGRRTYLGPIAINPALTVAELARSVPGAARVFETLGIDYFEHERVGAMLAELERVTGGYMLPARACGSYGALYAGLKELQADIHAHVHLENHVLFPAGLELERRMFSTPPQPQ